METTMTTATAMRVRSEDDTVALDDDLVVSSAEAAECVAVCARNEWQPAEIDVARLVRARRQVRRGRWNEHGLSIQRLRLVRQLVRSGRYRES